MELTFVVDEAIALLKNIRATYIESSKRINMNEEYGRNIQNIGSMMATGRTHETKNYANYFGYITPGTGAKLNTRCHACNSIKHWVGDPQCPLYGKDRK